MRTHKNAIVCRFVVQLQQALLKKCSRDTYIWVIKMVSTGSLTQGIVCIVWTQRCQHEDKYMYTRLNEIAPFFVLPTVSRNQPSLLFIYMHVYICMLIRSGLLFCTGHSNLSKYAVPFVNREIFRTNFPSKFCKRHGWEYTRIRGH